MIYEAIPKIKCIYTYVWCIYVRMVYIHIRIHTWCTLYMEKEISGSLVVLFVSEIFPLEDDPEELHFLFGCIMYNL